jgi:hypothetical protein
VDGKFASRFTEGYPTFAEAERNAKDKKCDATGHDVYGAPMKPAVVAVMFENVGLPPGKDWREQMAFLHAHPGWKADTSWLDKRPVDASQHWNVVRAKGSFNFAVYVPERQVWLGATGGETEAGSTIRQQPMEIKQQSPDALASTARQWKGQGNCHVLYFAVCPKDYRTETAAPK